MPYDPSKALVSNDCEGAARQSPQRPARSRASSAEAGLTLPRTRWGVRLEWIQATRAALLQERDRLEQSTRYRLGLAVVEFGRKPWQVRTLWRSLAGLVRQRRERVIVASQEGGPKALDPGLPQKPPLVAETESERRCREQAWLDTIELRFAQTCQELSFPVRLGAWLADAIVRPSRLLSLPSTLVARTLGLGHTRLPLLPLTADQARASGPWTAVGEPRARVRWACLAPPWLEEMLAHDGVVPVEGCDRADVLLVCLDSHSRQLAEPGELVARIRSARRQGTRVALWQVGADLDPAYDLALREADCVYADHDEAARRLGGRAGIRASHLPPAVQPRLQNPIGWWSGHSQPRCPWEWNRPYPAAWGSLFDAGRGQIVSRRHRDALELALGSPLVQARVPSWAGPDEAMDRQRFLNVRRILGKETLAVRLEQVGADLGLVREPRRELASVVLCSKRPRRIHDAIQIFDRQTYREKELVLVLHGEGFDLATIQAHLDDIEAPTRLVEAPADWTLGECMQLGCDESQGDWVFKMDDDDWYGPRYVESQVLALRVSQAGAATKRTHVVFLKQTGTLLLTNPGWEFCYARVSWGGGMVIRREVLDVIRWRPVPRAIDTAFFSDCISHGVPLLATDRFNAVRIRGRPRDHTWKVSHRFFTNSDDARRLPVSAQLEDFEV